MQGTNLLLHYDLCKSLLSVQQHLTSHTNRWYWLKRQGWQVSSQILTALSSFNLLLWGLVNSTTCLFASSISFLFTHIPVSAAVFHVCLSASLYLDKECFACSLPFLSSLPSTPSTRPQTQSPPDEHSWSCLMEPSHICSHGPSSPGCCISPHWGAGHQEGPLTDVNSSIPGKPHASPRLNRASDHKLWVHIPQSNCTSTVIRLVEASHTAICDSQH